MLNIQTVQSEHKLLSLFFFFFPLFRLKKMKCRSLVLSWK